MRADLAGGAAPHGRRLSGLPGANSNGSIGGVHRLVLPPPFSDRRRCSDRAKGGTVVYSGIVAVALVALSAIALVYALHRSATIFADPLTVLPAQSGWVPQEHFGVPPTSFPDPQSLPHSSPCPTHASCSPTRSPAFLARCSVYLRPR